MIVVFSPFMVVNGGRQARGHLLPHCTYSPPRRTGTVKRSWSFPGPFLWEGACRPRCKGGQSSVGDWMLRLCRFPSPPPLRRCRSAVGF